MVNPLPPSHRILVVDDNPAIHRDFQRILARSDAEAEALDEMESRLFGGSVPSAPREATMRFELDFASGGEDGVRRVQEALREGRPYALAFVRDL